MGFRTGAWAKVWKVDTVSDSMTKLRISVSRKDKESGEYEQDFSGFVAVVGTAAANKAASLHEGDRIKLGDVDVSTKYDKEKQKEYINYKMFSFELDDGEQNTSARTDPQPSVDDGEIEDPTDLPF